jgi:hypothetical protein
MFKILIINSRTTSYMKNIPPSFLQNFHGLDIEDLDVFLLEFDILYRSYDYLTNTQKLNLFPTTLKGASLLWFMGFRGDNNSTWEIFKKTFLKKY